MAAGRYDLKIEQGATFELSVGWVDPDGAPNTLVGFTARMMIRVDYKSSTPLLSLTGGAGLTLGGAAGTIDIEISDEDTADLPAVVGVWDLEVESPGGKVTRLVQGKAKISPEVTR